MDGHRDRRALDREPRGPLPPPAPGSRGPFRRIASWLFRNREAIDQEGLLAERTLRVARRRPPRDDED
jgi:hypothetical protein